jgi:hypothetical protein
LFELQPVTQWVNQRQPVRGCEFYQHLTAVGARVHFPDCKYLERLTPLPCAYGNKPFAV